MRLGSRHGDPSVYDPSGLALCAPTRLVENAKQMVDRIAVLGNPQHGASEEQRMYQLMKVPTFTLERRH